MPLDYVPEVVRNTHSGQVAIIYVILSKSIFSPVNKKAPMDNQKDNKTPIALQTKLAALSYIILLLVMIIVANMTNTQNDYTLNIMLFIIVSIVTLYTINCIVTGKCNLYAWFFAYIVFANALIYLLYIIINLYTSI